MTNDYGYLVASDEQILKSVTRTNHETTSNEAIDGSELLGALDTALEQLASVLLGKQNEIKLAIACFLARGHLLIEDLPGMGKTLLSQALATVLDLEYRRIQFTSDLLPSDILGVSVFDKRDGAFRFMPGPVFAQLVVADEINRATPKSQSALLEAMEERQVTCDGESRALPQPFFVVATQNPVTQTGTFPLPESQLDRFLMRIALGYPEPEAERELLLTGDRRKLLAGLEPVFSGRELLDMQETVDKVQVSDPLIDYVQRLVGYTRREPAFSLGLSPRGALALINGARAWALIHKRNYVIPEDVQAVLPSIVGHRVCNFSDFGGNSGAALVQKLLAAVDVVDV